MFIYLRNNALSREELNDEDGFAQSIHYGDVLIKYGECLNVSNELLPYIDNKNIVNKFKKFYIQNGDVIIADTAEDETVGKCIEISGIVDHNIISGLHTIPLRPVNKFAYGYLGFYLNSNIYHNQLKPLMQGIKVTSISKNLLKTTTLNYPSNIQEQKIIGRYFDALNHLITLHQSKSFEYIFKAIVNCTLYWEHRKLKYFADYKSSSLTVKDCKEEGKYDLYDANQVIGKTDKFVIDEDYITIIKDGAGVGRTRKLSKNTAFIGTMGALTVNNSDLDFLYATLNRIDWNTKTFGSTIPHIYFKDYGEKVYGEPSIEEQKKIGLYFKNLDTLITLHQLEPYKLIFKAIAYRIIDYAKSKPPRCIK